MKEFVRKYDDRIHGVLSCFDRILLRGYLFRYREISLQANARYLDAMAAVDDPTESERALQRLTIAKKDAAGRTYPGFNPLAQHDATIFRILMAGEHCLHGFTNRDMRERLTSTRLLRSCADDPKKASAKVTPLLQGLHAHGLIAKIPRTRRWRVTRYGQRGIAVPPRAPLPQCLRARGSLICQSRLSDASYRGIRSQSEQLGGADARGLAESPVSGR